MSFLPLVEYARRCGIARNHFDASHPEELMDEVRNTSCIFTKENFHDDHHFESLCRQGKEYIEKISTEKIIVSRETVQHLSNISNYGPKCTPENIQAAMQQNLHYNPSPLLVLDQAADSFETVCSASKFRVPELLPVKLGIHGANRDPNFTTDLALKSAEDESLPILTDQLSWSPFHFPHVRNVLAEQFEHITEPPEPVRKPRSVIQSHQLLWSAPLSEILDPDDMVVNNGEEGDLTVSKSVLEDCSMADEIQSAPLPIMTQQPHAGRSPMFGNRDESKQNTKFGQMEAQSHENPSELAKSSAFDLQRNLTSFLNLRGQKFKQPFRLQAVSTFETPSDPIEWTQHETNTTLDYQELVKSQSSNRKAFKTPDTSVLAPSGYTPLTPQLRETFHVNKTIILKTSLLETHVQLCIFLENNGNGKLSIIYRDSDVSMQIRQPNSIQPMPDMILNPRSCLLFSSLHDLNQKSLPGQRQNRHESPVLSAIADLARYYDDVFVLFICPSAIDNQLPQHTESITVSKNKFVAACAEFKHSQDVTIRPIWLPIPNGSKTETESLINHEIWSLVLHHGLEDGNPTTEPDQEILYSRVGSNLGSTCQTSSHENLFYPSLSFFAEQTPLESRLCRAGLNPMAAQIVIAHLTSAFRESRYGDELLFDDLKVVVESKRKKEVLEHFIGRRAIVRLKCFVAENSSAG